MSDRGRTGYAQSEDVIPVHGGALRMKLPPGATTATCWCERHYVSVRSSEVIAGRTRSCGHPECHA